jgi:glutamate synthase (ferredoxin)
MLWLWIGGILLAVIVVVAIRDLTQKKHAILRNFPVIGHFRYWIETIGPELRQYIVAANDEERPFNRDERSWVYASSKKQNNYFGFGTDNEVESSPNYLVINHNTFPIVSPAPDSPDYDPLYRIPCAKIMGGYRQRAKAFRPPSVVNVSGMSFGSLSAPAVEALNIGCKTAGCLQSTGEGAISPYHKKGGELVWQIGTGYYGCRTMEGQFSLEKLKENIAATPTVRALEVKLSQGAKPGAGGILPSRKITPEISKIRGIPMGKDCVSPATHSAFHDVDSLLDYVEMLADETGLPVGIKSAVGQLPFWRELAALTATTNRAPDFITIDGGEGGTGAAPLVFSDHVAKPFKLGFASVQRVFQEQGIAENIVWCGSGKLGSPEHALFAFALGCDIVNVARAPMLAIGCIQAQKCHTNHCPTGVATQNKWLVRGLDPTLKADRCANYLVALRKEILLLCRACGVPHPGMMTAEHLEIVNDRFGSQTVAEIFGYTSEYGLPSQTDREAVSKLMEEMQNTKP